MGQAEIGNILKNNYPVYMSATDIVLRANITRQNVFRSLKQMLKREEIEVRIVKGRKSKSTWETLYRSNGGI